MIVGLVFAVFAAMVLAGLVFQARSRARFRTLAERLGGLCGGRQFSAVHAGVPYICTYTEGRRYTPSSLTVRIDGPTGAAFRVSRSTAGLRFLVGRDAGLTTGDPAFDAEHVVASDGPGLPSALFAAPATRDAVRAMLAAGVAEVRRDGRWLVARWDRFDFGDRLADAIPQTIDGLVVLRDALVAMPVVPVTSVGRNARRARFALSAVEQVVLLLGILLLGWDTMTFTPLDWSEVLLDSLWTSVPLLGCFVFLALQLLRPGSVSLRELWRVVAVAILAFPFTGYTGVLALNCALDAGPPTTHTAVVVGRTTRTYTRSRSYYAVVRSWRGDREEFIDVPPTSYKLLVPERSHVTVVTRPGRLGHEWVVSSRVER